MRIYVWVLLSIVFLSSVSATNAQDRYFRILSFTKDGEKLDYKVTFEISKMTLSPKRQDDRIFVPKEVIAAESVAIQFKSTLYDFKFAPLSFNGYLESDKIKSDYVVEIDTPPFEHKNLSHVQGKNICAVFSLTRMPQLSIPENAIADPVRFIVVEHCSLK